MRITRVEIYPLTGMSFKRVFRISRGTVGGPVMEWGFNVMLKVATDEGFVGWGEVPPGNPYQGETTWSVVAALQRFYGPLLIGRDPWDIGPIHADMEAILPHNPFAQTTVDLALYDLMGKASGQPVYKLLGGLHNPRVGLKFPVGVAEPSAMVEEAHHVIEETGAHYLKVKIGPIERLQKDVAVMAALREEFGDTIDIQADANAGYETVHDALRAIRLIEEYRPVLIEQPLQPWNLAGMAEVAAAVETPILADESCWSPQDAFTITRTRAADVLNIKLPKSAGLYRARQIAAVAEAAGSQVFVGTMIETGIGAAADVHFFAATRNIWRVTPALLGTYMIVHDMLTEGTRFRLGKGYVEPPEAPGLGVEVDEEAIKRYSEGPIVVTGG